MSGAGMRTGQVGAWMVTGILLMWAGQAAGTTNGEQRFYFFGKAGDVIWIGEDIGGEYECSILHQVIVGDGAVHGKSDWRAYGKWDELVKMMGLLKSEKVVTLERRADGSLGAEGLGWTVSAPAAEPDFAAAFNKHIEAGGDNARTWREAQPERAMQMPVFQHARAQLLCRYERGLYVNYGLKAAYLLPNSGLLVVVTEQPLKAVGLDTMHGFLVLRVLEE